MEVIDSINNNDDEKVDESSGSEDIEHFSNNFISYPEILRFPDVLITKNDLSGKVLDDTCELCLTNKSNFHYTASLAGLPDWCFSKEKSIDFDPDETKSFKLGVKTHFLPPGNVTCQGKVVIKKPFIRLEYPIVLIISVKYDYIIPEIKVEVISPPDRKLRITIKNAGSGFLQGYCYNQVNGQMQKFNLSRSHLEENVDDVEKDSHDNNQKYGNEKFVVEQSFYNNNGNQSGLLIITDCPNQNFRRININPDEYLNSAKFADKKILHFSGMQYENSKDIELNIFQPEFKKKCTVSIPDHLKDLIQIIKEKSGLVIFRCSISDRVDFKNHITGYVNFQGIGDKKHSLPVAITAQ